jgi:RNA polymerase-associated protein
MSIVPNRRSGMVLYSSSDPYSHRVRIALAEKAVAVDVLDIKSEKIKEELNQLNPYGSVPTLLDRDLVLYTSEVIMEYLEERFPYPPLMPVYPIARARTRLMMYRLNRDWYALMDKILSLGVKKTLEIKAARKELTDSITSVAPVLSEMPFFLSEEFSLLDCCIAPLLWRLPLLEIELPIQAKSVLVYAESLFKRASFVASLSEIELAMGSIKK